MVLLTLDRTSTDTTYCCTVQQATKRTQLALHRTMLQENNVSIRFHGRGMRRTVAVDGSEKSWLLEDFGTGGGQVRYEIVTKLRETSLNSPLEAKRANDLSHMAAVHDLLDNGWKQLAYEIRPPKRSSARSSSYTQPLYCVPATGQVLRSSAFPAADQHCYSDWLVPGIDYRSEDKGVVDELTVGELIKAFGPAADCNHGPKRKAHAGRTAGQITTAGAAAPGQASSSQTAAKRKAGDSLLEQQQQQVTAAHRGSSATSRHEYQAATAPGQVATLLASKEPLDEQQIQQLLQLVLSCKCGMQQVLDGLQQHDNQQAFMAFACAAVRKRRADMLLAALAADCGRLMQHFLRRLSSSNVEMSAAAAEVFSEFTEVVHAGQFIAAVLETQKGIQLLAHAVLPSDSSAAVADGARAVSERFSELVRAAPATYVPMELRGTSTNVAKQCIDLLDPGRQHMSVTSSNQQLPENDSGRSSVMVALLLLSLARSNANAQAALACTVEPLMAALVTATAGPYQTLCLYGLWGVLELGGSDARRKLAQCDLAALVVILAQQDLELKLAASILRKVYDRVEPAHMPRLGSQLAQAATSSSMAAGNLVALDLLVKIGYVLDAARQETALVQLDVVLGALVQLVSTPAWHSSKDAKASVEEGLCWFCKVAGVPSTRPQLTATPQRVGQLAAVVLHAANSSGSELRFRVCLRLAYLASVLMKHLGVPGLLTLQLDVAPLAATKCQLLGPGSCWLRAFGAILQSLHEWESYQPDFFTALKNPDGAPQLHVMDTLDSIAALAQSLSDLHTPATPAVTPTATKATTLSLAELENLGASQLLLQALLGCTGWQGSVLAMKAFTCLRVLVSIPAYAFAVAAQYQDWLAIAKDLHSKIPDDKQQQLCFDDLAAVKRRIMDVQGRIIATSARAKSELEIAMRDCALEHQNLRVDPDDRQRQLMLAVQLQRLAKAVAYDSKAHEVRVEFEIRVKVQLTDSSE